MIVNACFSVPRSALWLTVLPRRTTRLKQEQKGEIKAGFFGGHLQGGYGRHLASNGLSFCAKILSFGGKSSFFHALSNKNLEKLNKNFILPPKC